MFTVATQEFSGPLEKLLSLVEEKKMDVTCISLAAVTADFLAFVGELKKRIEQEENMSSDDMRVLADFLVVAAQLILIKSRAVLPGLEISQEDEVLMAELERRLATYKMMQPVFDMLKKTWDEGGQSFERGGSWGHGSVFYPSSNLTPTQLSKSLQNVIRTVSAFVMKEEKIERQVVSLKKTIETLSSLVNKGASIFSEVVKDGSKEETIVSFLALLHLLRDSMVVARQDGLFGKIEMKNCKS